MSLAQSNYVDQDQRVAAETNQQQCISHQLTDLFVSTAVDDGDDDDDDDVNAADAGITIDGQNVRMLVINCIRPLLGN